MNTPDRKNGSGAAPDVSGSVGARRLRGETEGWLRARLGAGSAALPFAAAVTLQLARTPGLAASAAEEREVARRVAALLDAPAGPGTAASLAADPPLLAAVFQNADLLFAHHFPGADAVSLLVMEALALLEPSD